MDLAESGVWRWRSDVHLPLLSRLYRLSGTLFTPGGVCVYPHLIETIVAIAPRDSNDLTRFLSSVDHHNLVPDDQLQGFRFLSGVAARPTWEWNEYTHQAVLENLQDATGVILTTRGPVHMSRGRVLSHTDAIETRHNHRAGRGGRRAGGERVEGQDSSNPGAGAAAVAAGDTDEVADSDARSHHGQF